MDSVEQQHERAVPEPEGVRLHASKTVRVLFAAAGLLSLALGVIGAFLPLLPSTVFVLLAAFCFARSSERFYNALLGSRLFGPTIHNWLAYRCISKTARTRATWLIVITFAITIGFVVRALYLRFLLAALAAGLIFFLARLPLCRSTEEAEPQHLA